MKHILFALLLVSFSSALADTPAKIAEDYRKASAAAVVKVNSMLESATTPLIVKLVSSGDTEGADTLAEQLKAKLAGEAVAVPQASATLLFAQYDQARAKALEPAQKASIARIESLLKSAGKPTLETVTELSKVRAEIEAENAPASVAASAVVPVTKSGGSASKQVAEWVDKLGGEYIRGSAGDQIKLTRTVLTTADLLQLGAGKNLKSFDWVSGSGLTDEGMAAFEGMKNLDYLTLWAKGPITDAGLQHLGGCEKLELLNIGGNGDGITGTGFESLGQCKSLRQLTLNALPKVEGQNLRFLAKLKSLENLRLSACSLVADADMDWVGQMTNLKYLHVGRTGVTDAGLAKLTGLRHLEEITVTAPQVTPAGVELLKKSRPALVVIFTK
jgi:hypothetical protein